MQIGTRLAAARQRRGISQAQLAKRAGVGQATISRLENGEESSTTIDTFIKLSEALGVSPAIFLDDGKDTGRVWSFEREIPPGTSAEFIDWLDVAFRYIVRVAIKGPRDNDSGPGVNGSGPSGNDGYFKMKSTMNRVAAFAPVHA